jgi:hypothetical protein
MAHNLDIYPRTQTDDVLSVLYRSCSPDEIEAVMNCIAALGDKEGEVAMENLRAIAPDPLSYYRSVA